MCPVDLGIECSRISTDDHANDQYGAGRSSSVILDGDLNVYAYTIENQRGKSPEFGNS